MSSLVKRHREEREALATLEGEVNAIAAERQRLRALVDEHARASAMLASVEQDALEELRDAYRSSARFLDDATLLPRFPEPPLRGLARRVSGVTTRTRYLSALFVHHNERPRGRLTTHLQDVSLVLREGASALRGGIGETAAEIERETERRRCEVEEQIRRYRSTAQRLMAFTRWDDCDPLAGQLWWDAFTGGLIDGSFIDEVAWHRTMGRPRGTALTGGVDRRDAWAANAESAMDALAAAHAEVLAAKRNRDHGDDDDGVDDGGDDGATVPAPVELPDDER